VGCVINGVIKMIYVGYYFIVQNVPEGHPPTGGDFPHLCAQSVAILGPGRLSIRSFSVDDSDVEAESKVLDEESSERSLFVAQHSSMAKIYIYSERRQTYNYSILYNLSVAHTAHLDRNL